MVEEATTAQHKEAFHLIYVIVVSYNEYLG